MVTALLRALGFDDEAEAPPGEGQDRAPVGAGQDVPEDVTQARQRAARDAAQPWLGTQYRLGGNDQRAVDCSGLVNALLRGFGAQIPGRPSTTTYRDQLAAPIDWKTIQPGDVLISPANRADPVSGEHMALYVGGGQMVEASGTAGQVRYSDVTNRNLQPYRLREPVPGLQQVTLMAQREGDLPQGGPPGGQSAPSPSVQQIAMQALTASDPRANNAELADIMAAGALKESGANPNGPPGDGGASIGMWQLHERGVGHGMSEAERRDPATAAARIAPEYQRAYAAGLQQGYNPQSPQGQADLATYTYINAEHPADAPGTTRPATMTGPTAQQFRAHYADVDAHSKQQQELQVGGGYAPPSGAPGQANAGGPQGPAPNLVAQAQQTVQGLVANLGGAVQAAGERVAGLGATPAYAQTASPVGPPPGPTPQVQQPPPSAPTHPGPTDVDAHGQPLGPQVPLPAVPGSLVSERQGAPAGVPPVAPPPTAQAPPPPAPTPSLGPPQGATTGRAQSNIPPGYTPPGQGPPAGPAGPPAAAPDTTIPGRHWDPTVVDATTGQVVGDQVPEVPAYARNWQTPGQWVRVSERTATMPANQPSALQYRPTVSGNYDFGAGPVFYDAQANTTSQPNAASQRQQGATVENYGNGLTVSKESATSPTGTATYVDPNGTILQAPWSQTGGFGEFQPAGGPTPGLSPGQQQQGSQYQQTFEAQQAQNRVTNSLDQQRLDQAATAEANRVAASNRQFTDVTADTSARLAAEQAHQRQVNSVPVVGADNNLYGADPTNPDPNAPLVNLGAATPTPVQQASIAASQAQTQNLQAQGRAPYTVGPYTYQPQFDDQGNATDPLNLGLTPPSAEQQTLADERAHEFGTLSAYQQSQAEQSKASLAQNESQFQQKLTEQKSEADKPYQQMTKAEQARVGIEQQQLGLDTQKLGLQENQAANQLETLPRGGIMRVDPFTGQSSLINAPEPEDIRMVGSQIYIPGGRQVSMLGQQITGGPNPYAGVPTGGGGMFQYPGAQGGQASPYQNWGGQGGGGWGGGGMSSSPGWAPPQQQRQGWMGGY